MIDQLLDEPVELNEKALVAIETFIKGEKFFYNNFTWRDLSTSRLNSAEEKDAHKKVAFKYRFEIENTFTLYIKKSLSRMNSSIEKAVILDPEFIKDFREKRDLSVLVLSAMSLETLRQTYHNFKVYGDGLETCRFRRDYFDCVTFMIDYFPQMVKLHQKILGGSRD